MHRVFIAASNDAVVKPCLKALTMPDYQLATLTDSTAVLREIRAFAPQLVLLDAQLNGDAFEICSQLKQDRGRMVLMVTQADLREVDRAVSVGADDFMLEPLEEAALRTRSANLLRPHSRDS